MLTEDRLRESFPHFIEVAWAYLGLPKPDRLQNDIAEYLQHGPSRRFICGLRGIGKSYELCAYRVWKAWNNPDLIAVVRSGTSDNAKKNVSLIRQLVDVIPLLRHMAPGANEGNDNNLKDIDGAYQFNWGHKKHATKDPSISAYGIMGSAVGSHPDEFDDDDIETPTNSLTVAARDKLMTLAADRENMIKKDGIITILGTFQSMDSIYKRDIENGVFDVRMYPARYPGSGKIARRYLAPILAKDLQENPGLDSAYGELGEATYPTRFNHMDLLRGMASNKALHYCHMLLDPELGDVERHPLKCRNLIVASVNEEQAPAVVVWGLEKKLNIRCPGFSDDGFYAPAHTDDKWLTYTQSVMTVDPSGSGGDETAWCTAHQLNGNVFISSVGGLKDGHSEETMRRIIEAARSKKIKQIIVEPNFSDGLYAKLLQSVAAKAGYVCSVEDGVWAKGQKEQRIIGALEPALNMHRVVVDHSVAADEVLMHQLTHITRDRGSLKMDDRIEVMADAVKFFTDQVAVDQEKRLKEAQKAEADAQIKKFDKDMQTKKAGRWVATSMFGGTPRKKRPTWF